MLRRLYCNNNNNNNKNNNNNNDINNNDNNNYRYLEWLAQNNLHALIRETFAREAFTKFANFAFSPKSMSHQTFENSNSGKFIS